MTLRLKRDRRRADTYDAVQMAAVLTTCGTCGRAYFMTNPGPVCIRCRQATQKRTHMIRLRLCVPLLVLLVLTGCDYNLGPTVNVSNTNTNTNTNTNNNDLHDLVNFAPVANPTAPLPAPGGGTETPLGIPAGSQASAQTYATQNPVLLARSCQAVYGEPAWQFLDGMIKTLRATDPRWGYVIKANTGTISQDVIAYRATSDNTGAWGVDVIVDHCGTPSFAWNVLGLDANLSWSGTRF